MSARCYSSRSRRALTLLELVLTLALLVVLASLAAPIVGDAFASVRLRQAGDHVLAAWNVVRREAIDSGEIREFRFLTGEGRYRVDRWVVQDDAQRPPGVRSDAYGGRAVGGSSLGGSSPASTSAGRAELADPLREGALLEGIRFVEGQRALDDGRTRSPGELELGGTGAAWSEPVLFFPDGTTSSASVVIANLRNLRQRLTLRGLTGAGRASLVMDQTELERTQAR